MVAIYARQSIDKKDSISVDTQIEFCKREVADGEDYEVFQDRGFSGKNTARPGFMRLMGKVEKKQITKIIVYKLDRISRSITDFAGIMEQLEENKVAFVSANEKFDTSTPAGRAMLYIVMIFAQLERETIAERIRDNYYARGKTGVWVGGVAPLGFDNMKVRRDGKLAATIVPNDELEKVKEVYDLYANTNASLAGVARVMRERDGKMWNNIKVARILSNPAYVKADADIFAFYNRHKCIIVNDISEFTGQYGCNLYGKRDANTRKYLLTDKHVLSIGFHEGVVESSVWLSCARKLAGNKQIKNEGKGKHTWLSGLMKCGYCGYTMNVKPYTLRDGSVKKHLTCSGRHNTGMCGGESHGHTVDEVEEIAYTSLIEYSKAYTGRVIEHRRKQSDTDNRLKIELHEIDTKIENLIQSLATANTVVTGYINDKISEMDARKSEIIHEMNLSSTDEMPDVMPDLTDWENLDRDTRHTLAVRFIAKVYIFSDSIEVKWRV